MCGYVLLTSNQFANAYGMWRFVQQLGLAGLEAFGHEILSESIDIKTFTWILNEYGDFSGSLLVQVGNRWSDYILVSRLILLRRSAPPTTQRILESCSKLIDGTPEMDGKIWKQRQSDHMGVSNPWGSQIINFRFGCSIVNHPALGVPR